MKLNVWKNILDNLISKDTLWVSLDMVAVDSTTIRTRKGRRRLA